MAEQGAEVEAISEAPSPVKRHRGDKYSADRRFVIILHRDRVEEIHASTFYSAACVYVLTITSSLIF